MSSYTASNLLVTGFLIAICAAATPFSFDLPTTARQVSCTTNADCTATGCECLGTSLKFCANRLTAEAELEACPKCTSNADCPGDAEECDSDVNRCGSCVAKAGITAMQACQATTPGNTGGRPVKSDQKPCIATSWLVERGLEHAAIRHAGVANILCIPGNTALPCGTPGHLLRECAGESGECKLVTYREVCQRHGDCIRSTAPVSQLSHVHNWSPYRMVSGKSEFELTSMSAHPLSGPWSPSRLVANGGDYLNRMGLGWICNAVALFKIDSYSVLKNAMFTES